MMYGWCRVSEEHQVSMDYATRGGFGLVFLLIYYVC